MEKKCPYVEIKMNKQAMRSFVFQHNNKNPLSIVGFCLGVLSLVMFVAFFESLNFIPKFILMLVAIAFLIARPYMLILQADKMVETEEKKVVEYTFAQDGLLANEDNEQEFLPWDKVKRIAVTSKIIAIYDTKLHAFVLPLNEMGSERAAIVETLIQNIDSKNVKVSAKIKKYI